MEKIENKLKKIMVAVLRMEAENIKDDSSIYNIDNWDSIRHMSLFICIEEEFDIEFDEEEMNYLVTYKLICEGINNKMIDR